MAETLVFEYAREHQEQVREYLNTVLSHRVFSYRFWDTHSQHSVDFTLPMKTKTINFMELGGIVFPLVLLENIHLPEGAWMYQARKHQADPPGIDCYYVRQSFDHRILRHNMYPFGGCTGGLAQITLSENYLEVRVQDERPSTEKNPIGERFEWGWSLAAIVPMS